MNTNAPRETAKIYQFPRRTQTAGIGERRDLQWTHAARMEGLLAVDFGSGWYHQAAVDDAERGRK